MREIVAVGAIERARASYASTADRGKTDRSILTPQLAARREDK